MAILSTGQASLIRAAANDEGAPGRLPNPICWHQGMLLSPQHFQQNHLYWEEQLRQRLSLLQPHYWGIGRLELDPIALAEGSVDIRRLIAVMPDGLLIDYHSSVDERLQLALDMDFSQGPVTIQLAVPIQVAGSASERSEIQRYISREDRPKVDENTGDNELVMPRLVPRLSLQSGDQVSHRYVGLPLFRVVQPDGGSLQLDPDYAPPLLNIAADHFRHHGAQGSIKPLMTLCAQLALAIRQKARQLAGLSEQGEQLGRNIAQRHHRWIRAMVQELASFELVAGTDTATPYELYQSLVRLAGPVSELDPNGMPPAFRAYSHDNALPGFLQVLRYVQQQISRVNLNYTTLSFDEERSGCFTLAFDKAWEGRDLLIELRPSHNGNSDGVSQWLKTARIASASIHKVLQQRRLLGAKSERIQRDQRSDIEPAQGNALFRVKADKALIRAGAKLLIVCTSDKLKGEQPAAILLHMPHE
ncbi:type VI secretion protein [Bacterioplanes sanyensis]|jgi:type VI secretion system protein ImpJ|uniref:type VI secretion system baseplate subunit TssK n=1 Tax=Bacterioplanes sanyensis TaxID=1249553 RepID=UPI001672D57B|nr:type VI secretion system baseplate subunit TssK [Bacterioplanes sanyensis]GGY41758.1 type VI secretion protein [Bacterioplanes sanyensis]